jgi:protein-tyrosine phosphatase
MTAPVTSDAPVTPDALVSPDGPARHLPLAGTYNVRDAGGYPTADGRVIRWRTLFRADSLHRLDEEGQAHLIDAGLRTVVDLRRDVELEQAPNVLAASGRVRYVWISLAPNPTDNGERRELAPDSLARTYRAIVDGRRAELLAVFQTLAGPGAFPALVHCTAGKDRTGIVVALLLGLAGVDHATIAEDYALSSTYLTEAYFADARVRAEAAGYDWTAYQTLLGCPAELMLATLTDIEARFGGVEAYLREVGLTDGELAALRLALVGER